MIQIQGIQKSYGNKVVLNDISVTLPTKKIIAFIGSNGAGKSTLLSIISRLLSKDKGRVIIDDIELEKWDRRELSQRMAVLRQSNYTDLRLTVRELVSFGRFPYSQGKLTAEDETMINKALTYLKIEDIQNQFLDELSGGQRQMAYIAMVICQDTDYVLLDEPLNNLDMKHSVRMMKTLRSLVDDLGKTVLIVIHDINFVSCYADYVLALRHGEYIKGGEKDQIITSPILQEIYDMEINIQNVNDDRICVYYR